MVMVDRCLETGKITLHVTKKLFKEYMKYVKSYVELLSSTTVLLHFWIWNTWSFNFQTIWNKVQATDQHPWRQHEIMLGNIVVWVNITTSLRFGDLRCHGWKKTKSSLPCQRFLEQPIHSNLLQTLQLHHITLFPPLLPMDYSHNSYSCLRALSLALASVVFGHLLKSMILSFFFSRLKLDPKSSDWSQCWNPNI